MRDPVAGVVVRGEAVVDRHQVPCRGVVDHHPGQPLPVVRALRVHQVVLVGHGPPHVREGGQASDHIPRVPVVGGGAHDGEPPAVVRVEQDHVGLDPPPPQRLHGRLQVPEERRVEAREVEAVLQVPDERVQLGFVGVVQVRLGKHAHPQLGERRVLQRAQGRGADVGGLVDPRVRGGPQRQVAGAVGVGEVESVGAYRAVVALGRLADVDRRADAVEAACVGGGGEPPGAREFGEEAEDPAPVAVVEAADRERRAAGVAVADAGGELDVGERVSVRRPGERDLHHRVAARRLRQRHGSRAGRHVRAFVGVPGVGDDVFAAVPVDVLDLGQGLPQPGHRGLVVGERGGALDEEAEQLAAEHGGTRMIGDARHELGQPGRALGGGRRGQGGAQVAQARRAAGHCCEGHVNTYSVMNEDAAHAKPRRSGASTDGPPGDAARPSGVTGPGGANEPGGEQARSEQAGTAGRRRSGPGRARRLSTVRRHTGAAPRARRGRKDTRNRWRRPKSCGS